MSIISDFVQKLGIGLQHLVIAWGQLCFKPSHVQEKSHMTDRYEIDSYKLPSSKLT